jgi:hypothetical protein
MNKKMKKYGLSLVLLNMIIISTIAQENIKEQNRIKREKNLPEITFEQTEYDFGIIPYDSNATYKFVFRNTGRDPLVLNNVKASCGCTTPVWSKEPVARKDTSCIKVHYDTKRVGPFQKTIMVYSNAKNSPVILTIRGEVGKPERKRRGMKNNNEPENTFENPRRVPEN